MTRSSTRWWHPLLVLIIVAYVLGHYMNLSGSVAVRVLSIRDGKGVSLFFVDEQPDGRHTYTAKLVNLPWPCSDQEESGDLSSADWAKLSTYCNVNTAPEGHEPYIEEPWDQWGTLERGAETIALRVADRWELEDRTVIGSAFSRLNIKSEVF